MAHEHNQQADAEEDGRMNERLRYPREVFQWLTNTTNKLMQKNIVSFFWLAFSWLPFIGKLIFLNQEDRQTDAKAQTLI
jgi:hypothetical protein